MYFFMSDLLIYIYYIWILILCICVNHGMCAKLPIMECAINYYFWFYPISVSNLPHLKSHDHCPIFVYTIRDGGTLLCRPQIIFSLINFQNGHFWFYLFGSHRLQWGSPFRLELFSCSGVLLQTERGVLGPSIVSVALQA